MRGLLSSAKIGSWHNATHTMAPANAAIGNSRRPWNSRTPFQIMPQARKVIAGGNSLGNSNSGAGVPQSAIDAAPIK